MIFHNFISYNNPSLLALIFSHGCLNESNSLGHVADIREPC